MFCHREEISFEPIYIVLTSDVTLQILFVSEVVTRSVILCPFKIIVLETISLRYYMVRSIVIQTVSWKEVIRMRKPSKLKDSGNFTIFVLF